MDIALLISRYGLLAVFLGTLLEGETVLLLAGFAAHRGYLDFAAVVAVAWLGGVLGDQFYFGLGRRHGQTLLARWPGRAPAVERALRIIARHPVKIVLAMRFAWGLRTALPIAIGMSGMPRWRFLLLNAASATLWAPVVAGAGWLFGEAVSRHVQDIQRIEHGLIAAVVAAAILAHLWRRWRGRHRP